MPDLSQMSDEELMRIAAVQPQGAATPPSPAASMSDEELMKAAGIQNKPLTAQQTDAAGLTVPPEVNIGGQSDKGPLGGSKILDTLAGTAEVPLNIATSTIGGIIGDVGSMGAAAIGGAGSLIGNKKMQDIGSDENARNFRNFVADYYTYKPQSQSGQQSAELAGKVLGYIPGKVRDLGEAIGGEQGGNIADTLMLAAGPKMAEVTPKIAGKVAETTSNIKEGAARTLYDSALKGSTTVPLEMSKNITDTLLRHEIPISSSGVGVEKLWKTVDDLESQSHAALKTAQANGARVSTAPIIDALEKLKQDYANLPEPDTAAIERITAKQQAILDNRGETLNPLQAQSMKKQIYQNNKKSYDRNAKSLTIETDPLKTAMDKAQATGLRQAIEDIAPETKYIHAEQGNLLQALPDINRASNRAGNYNIVPLRLLVGAVGGAAAGGIVGGPIGAVVAYVADHPIVKSKMAIALSKQNKMSVKAARAEVARMLDDAKKGVDTYPGGLQAQYTENRPGRLLENNPDVITPVPDESYVRGAAANTVREPLPESRQIGFEPVAEPIIPQYDPKSEVVGVPAFDPVLGPFRTPQDVAAPLGARKALEHQTEMNPIEMPTTDRTRVVGMNADEIAALETPPPQPGPQWIGIIPDAQQMVRRNLNLRRPTPQEMAEQEIAAGNSSTQGGTGGIMESGMARQDIPVGTVETALDGRQMIKAPNGKWYPISNIRKPE